MKRALELAVDHLQSITSPYYLDLKILTAGIADAAGRIEALESANAKAAFAPKPVPYVPGT